MDEKLYNEILELMDELAEDTSIPRNVRKTSSDSKEKLQMVRKALI